jgi:DNA-binding beta-propeller fold protein YncE
VARENHLLVLDAGTGKQIADIGELPNIAGIAVAPGLDRGYVTSSADNRALIFAPSDFRRLGRVRVGGNPGEIFYDASAHRFYAMNRGSGTASAIDGDDGEVEQTIAFGGRPGGVTGNGHGAVYAVVEDKGEVVQIDAKKMASSNRWPIPGCQAPHGIAMDDTRGRLFIGCSDRVLVVLNAADGKLIASARTGEGGGGIAADPSSGLVYAANRDGSVSVLAETSAGKYETIETVPTEKGATALAFDAATHRLYVLAPSRILVIGK